ncbi:MAG TPA: hypothetical protein DCM86_08810 [Verrucomicrobiales bacterium]|nr:hypothetical protein [Verrucomicrobiales bacterium]
MPGGRTLSPATRAGWSLQLAVLGFLAFSLLRAAAAPKSPDETDLFFNSGPVPFIRVEIPEDGMKQLRREARQYVRATVTEGGHVYTNVGVHLKGAAGSFRPVDAENPALTLNFDKFQEGQKFHGLDKLHLNNSVQDPSYTTELLCGELFLAAGVPAARAGHAVVELNGRRLGLYVLKEGFGKNFLKRHFSNPRGNLYDGGFLREISEPMERISGIEPTGQPEVAALVKACEIPDERERLAALEKRLDVDRFLSFIAMEMMVWHWDGYLMKKNNYRVYHDPDSDKISFFPHGMDQMFWQANGPVFPQAEGLVAASILNTREGRARYKARATQLTTNVFLVGALTNRILQVQARLRPVLASLDPQSAAQHDQEVRKLIREVEQRGAYLHRVLGGEGPKPVVFPPENVARVQGWKSRVDSGDARFSEGQEQGIPVLVVEAVPPTEPTAEPVQGMCLASYRVTVLLHPGRYAFEGRVRTDGVVSTGKSTRGLGAGLRISQHKRQNSLSGDAPWQEISYEFTVKEEEEEVELICDLRGSKGKAFFDRSSLLLRRLPDAPAESPSKPTPGATR